MPRTPRPPVSPPVTTENPAPTERATGSRVPLWVLAIFCVGGAAYVMLLISALGQNDGDLLHALTLVPILVGLTIPIALRIARTDRDARMVGIVMAGLVAKLGAGYVRFWVAQHVYGGFIDAMQYDREARPLVSDVRHFVFNTNPGPNASTGFIKFVTSVVYAIFGTSTIGGFFVFAWISFLGFLLMTRAFRIGVPQGDTRRYTIVVLFLPALLYWPATIGKEAWMIMALGLSALGIAKLFQRQPGGVGALVLGVIAMLAVRPHLAVIVFVGLVFAFLVRRAPARSYATPIFRLLGLTFVILAGVFLLGRTQAFINDTISRQNAGTGQTTNALGTQLSFVENQTSDGGSQFTPVRVRSPIDVPPAFFTVFFRPLPFEVHSSQELVSAAEGMFLLVLLLASRQRLRSIPRMLRTTPYVAFCTGYVFAFVFAFSSFANFGILARQRVQALPFLLVALALPKFGDLVAAGSTKAVKATTAPVEPAAPPSPNPRRRRRRPARPARDRIPVSTGASFPPPQRDTTLTSSDATGGAAAAAT